MAKQALGKGLGALIGGRGAPSPEAEKIIAPPADGEQVLELDIKLVGPSPMQPRTRFNEENLAELVDSIREHDVIQPLIVRKVGKNFELIAGERRWRACQKLERKTVPAIIREATDQDVLELALIENLQREDLDPIEEAVAYSKLAKDFKLKQEEIATRVGKNRATVANAIRLLDLPESVQGDLSAGRLTVGHAKALLGGKNAKEQERLAAEVIAGKLTVRAAEALVKKAGQPSKPADETKATAKDPALEASLQSVEDRLRAHFTSGVTLRHGDKKGKIEVEYYGVEDLNRVLEKMGILSADDS